MNAEGQKRFVVMQGNHRVAVLSVLGWSKIPVRIQPKICQPKVSILHKHRWKYWNQLRPKREKMELIFESFFKNSGQHIENHIFDD